MDKIITLEQMANMPIDDIVNLYRDGYTIENSTGSSGIKIPGLTLSPNRIVNLQGGTGDLIIAIVALAVGALVYYKLGKWEAQKLHIE